jgi:uncharacterized protein (DUF488 family)
MNRSSHTGTAKPDNCAVPTLQLREDTGCYTVASSESSTAAFRSLDDYSPEIDLADRKVLAAWRGEPHNVGVLRRNHVLIRQKTVLAMLWQAKRTLNRTEFVKLMFLLRHETTLRNEGAFYDFVPYRYGPFSFSLYREITSLRRDGYLTADDDRIDICSRNAALAKEKVDQLPQAFQEAVARIIKLYGRRNRRELLQDVYTRYPWYATKSELVDPHVDASAQVHCAAPAVYTAGYQGRSIDGFFDHLLQRGIHLLIDVRANPVSRRYGFSKMRLTELSERLALRYRHMPGLGIPSKYRTGLSDFSSYQRLLDRYDSEIIPQHGEEIDEVGMLMEEVPAVLVCMERDVHCCHRSRLAEAVHQRTGLEVVHI